MKVKFLSLVTVFFIILSVFSSCGCKHEWSEADCVTPKTCKLCDEIEGEALGHKWLDATCISPKTCRNCDEVEGESLGHDWLDATTEAPITCSRCKVTEGKKIETDPRFTTESTKDFYGKWSCDVVVPGEMIETEGYLDEFACTLYYDFKNDGQLTRNVEFHDYFAIIDALKAMTRDTIIYSLIADGFSEEDIDEAMLSTYGLTLDEFVEEYINSIDLDDIFGVLNADLVYYVGQNGIYIGDSWFGDFEFSEYTLEGDTLIIEEDYLEEGDEPFEWKRVTE